MIVWLEVCLVDRLVVASRFLPSLSAWVAEKRMEDLAGLLAGVGLSDWMVFCEGLQTQ